jgi:hypothetical protein
MPNTTTTQNPPNQRTNQKSSAPSPQQNRKPTGQPSSKPGQNKGKRPHGKSRYAKKKSNQRKPVVVKRAPLKSYISGCCNLPATKPATGQVEVVQDPETKKMKDKAKGLGHWRCTGCRKSCKVTPKKAEVVEAVVELPVSA